MSTEDNVDDRKRMTNPALPDAEIWARPKQVPVREAAGWVLDSETPAEQAPPDEQAPPSPVTTTKAARTPAATQEG